MQSLSVSRSSTEPGGLVRLSPPGPSDDGFPMTAIASAAPPPLAAVLAELAGVTEDKRSPASYLRLAREVEERGAELGAPRRVAWLASFTTELFRPYLIVEAARRGVRIDPYFAAFGQIEQAILDDAGALYAARPELAIIAIRIEDTAPALADGFVGLAPPGARRLIDDHVARLEAAARALRQRSTARVLVWNQPPPRRLAAGLADPTLELAQSEMVGECNRALARRLAAISDVYVFDAHRVATELGTAAFYDAKLAHLARMPFTPRAQAALAAALARHAAALWRAPCKCLVLDIDNTLWGGVLGEDGLAGIALGGDYPGSAFTAFQRVVASYRDRGVLLALASKNNEADVAEAFAQHPGLVLRIDDFVARQIHWNDKAGSLRAIAAELNLGLDALAFFDDSPVERAWVRQQLPEVTVIDVPASPLGFGDALDASGAFDLVAITREDRERTRLYHSDQARQRLADATGSVDDFLRALAMRISIGAVAADTLPRVVQLLAKTNQFNTTTRRHGQAELEAMIARGAIALWMRVEDRFGDNGLVGVAIAVPEPGAAPAEPAAAFRIDAFLMSCRVLGRRAEHALLGSVARRARAAGTRQLIGEFIPTRKNAPAAGFYRDAGFAPVAGEPGCWRLALPQAPPDAAAAPGDLFEVLEVS
jgi:FkbH-like protein